MSLGIYPALSLRVLPEGEIGRRYGKQQSKMLVKIEEDRSVLIVESTDENNGLCKEGVWMQDRTVAR
jgi:hypothetical protein